MRLPVLALLGVAVLAAAPIPAPVVVEEPGALPAGLTLTPAVHRLEVPADGALVTHHLAVGSGERVVFDLAVREVAPDPDGVPELGPASDAVRLPASSVTLDAGEQATVTSLVHGGLTEPRLVGVTATPRSPDRDGRVGAGRLVGLLSLVPPGTPAAAPPTVAVSLDEEVVTVTLRATGAAHVVADLRVRLAAPVGPALLDDALHDTVVWPDRDRQLDWALDLPPWPVPYTLQAVAATGEGEVARAEVTVWPPVGAWLPAVAAALVIVAAVAWWRLRRRGRDDGRDPPDAPDEPGGSHG